LNRILTAGLILIGVGVLLIVANSAGQANSSFGGVVFIGPFPIVFGAGPQGTDLSLLSLAIGAVMFVLFIIWGLSLKRGYEA